VISHLEAIKTLLAPLGNPVYLIDATGATVYPYYLVWPSTGAPGADGALDENADLSFLIGVTAVGESAVSAGGRAAKGKALLGPTKPVPLIVPGRKAWIRWEGLGNADVDRDVNLPNTSRHPAFEAHLYRVESIPA
jgi:hypothetical protein